MRQATYLCIIVCCPYMVIQATCLCLMVCFLYMVITSTCISLIVCCPYMVIQATYICLIVCCPYMVRQATYLCLNVCSPYKHSVVAKCDITECPVRTIGIYDKSLSLVDTCQVVGTVHFWNIDLLCLSRPLSVCLSMWHRSNEALLSIALPVIRSIIRVIK